MKTLKWTCMIVAAALVCVLFVCGCNITTVKIESGECGDDAEWTLSDGVLTVEGSGAVDVPIETVGEVSSIVVEDGITEIGDEVFKNVAGVTEIELPESLFKIGKEAFSGLTGISEITIPDSVKEIASDAFEGWEDSQKIITSWYEGSVDNWEKYYDLWKNVFDEFKCLLEDDEVREKVMAFANKWGTYIKDHYNAFVETYSELSGTAAEEILGIFGNLEEYEDEFVNDLFELLPYIEKVLNNIREKGQSIKEEVRGVIGQKLDDLYFVFGDAREIIGDSAEDYFELFSEVLPQYKRGIKAILGIEDDVDVPEETGASDAEAGDDDIMEDWRSFWEGIDPEVFDLFYDTYEKEMSKWS